MDNKQKLFSKKVTFYSFLCSLMVVYIHVDNINNYGIDKNLDIYSKIVFYLERIITLDLFQVAVPSFFMFSGYWFFKKLEKNSDILQKWKKRIWTLVIPYILWNLIGYVYCIIITRLPVIASVMNRKIDFSLETILKALFLYKYQGNFWYLYQLIIYVFLTPLISLAIKNKKLSIVYLGALLVFCMVSPYQFDTKWFYFVPQGLLYFSFGAVCGRHFSHKVEDMSWLKDKKILILLFVISQIFCFLGWHYSKNWTILFKLIFPVLFFSVFDFIKLPEKKWYHGISFYIYASHSMILESVEKLIYVFFPRTTTLGLISFIVSPVISIMIIMLTALILKKYMQPVWKLLNGGR